MLLSVGLALAPPTTVHQQQQPTITLLLERRDGSGDRYTTFAVAPEESIQSLKLRMLSRSAFTHRHTLVSDNVLFFQRTVEALLASVSLFDAHVTLCTLDFGCTLDFAGSALAILNNMAYAGA